MNSILSRKINEVFFDLNDPLQFKQKMLAWCSSFEVVSCLDSNEKQDGYSEFDCLLAVGATEELTIRQEEISQGDPFQILKEFYEQKPSWLFGFLTYDLKNSIEKLKSTNHDGLGFPDLHFFRPKHLLRLKANRVCISSNDLDPTFIFHEICSHPIDKSNQSVFSTPPQLKARISRAEYLKTIAKVKEHLHRGDIYELNFCQEFFAENCQFNPLRLFVELNRVSKAPFAAFYRLYDQYLLCSSPERFLKKKGKQLISQPIKGTVKRGETLSDDEKLKQQLLESQKDRSENVMIVDLVRNDLSKSCLPGSVQVDELFGIYTFEQVHQMISTIRGTLDPKIHFIEAIRNAFPMGSMTGAPKVRSMQLIEKYEQSKRALYSGAIGYIKPDGDFDFNVVIRSMLYQAKRQYLSFQVGGAIVYDSIPEKEYEECLLKAKGILEAMNCPVDRLL